MYPDIFPSDNFHMIIIVQTQAHIFLNNRQLEFDELQPLTVRLSLLIYPNFGNHRPIPAMAGRTARRVPVKT